MYKTNNLGDIKLIRKKNEIIILNKHHYCFYQACKGICNKKIDSGTKYIWINYFKETENNRKTIEYFKNLEEIIRKECHIKEPIHPFFNSNGFGVNTQNYGNKLFVDLYISKDIKLELEDCPDKFYITPLIWFQNLKLVENRWYLNIKLVQAIISPIFLRFSTCLVEDVILKENILIMDKNIDNHLDKSIDRSIDKNQDKSLLGKTMVNRIKCIEHPTYGKYFKMIQMGIPFIAVEMRFKNEIGLEKLDILNNKPDDLVEVQYVRQCETNTYSKFFKMLGLGIPRIAVEQKMQLEGYEINILNNPDELVIDMPKQSNNFMELFLKVKLKKSSRENKADELINRQSIQKINKPLFTKFNMEELLKKRNEILNK